MSKQCTKCLQEQPLENFNKDSQRKDGLNYRCKTCVNQYNRNYERGNPKVLAKSRKRYSENKEQYRDWELKRLFGISLIEYNQILTEQNNVCKICKKSETAKNKKNLAVDHCHVTGKVRGLLCSNCNLGIGNFQDNVEFLKEAINYLLDSKDK